MTVTNHENKWKFLKEKAKWVRRETIKIHKRAPETRLASSMSDVEVFVALYYGGILTVDPKNPKWESRDRFIISKGHGGISLYPVLTDLGFFDSSELEKVCQAGSFLGSIPDDIPGFETINGSLGHGLGVAVGMALALRAKRNNSKIFVLVGDGELCEGSVWEAIMFAGQHNLENLLVVVDRNGIAMLDYMANIMKFEQLNNNFENFGWKVEEVEGHNIQAIHSVLKSMKCDKGHCPKVLIANTVKGKGVPQLENGRLCHTDTLSPQECDELLKALA